MKNLIIAALVGIIAVGALTACEPEEESYRPAPRPASTPRSQEVTPRPQPKRAASVSGTGTQTGQMTLSEATYVCTSTVKGNTTTYGDGTSESTIFIVRLHGDFGVLESSFIVSAGYSDYQGGSGSWDKVVKAGGGEYLVEVETGNSAARWTVSCR